MTYLDDTPPRFTPPTLNVPHRKNCTCYRCTEKDAVWQQYGHEGISEDFSSDKTPQERIDEER